MSAQMTAINTTRRKIYFDKSMPIITGCSVHGTPLCYHHPEDYRAVCWYCLSYITESPLQTAGYTFCSESCLRELIHEAGKYEAIDAPRYTEAGYKDGNATYPAGRLLRACNSQKSPDCRRVSPSSFHSGTFGYKGVIFEEQANEKWLGAGGPHAVLCSPCFEWEHWNQIASKYDKGLDNAVIVNGNFYTLGRETESTPPSCRGFGGQKFVIRFHDGREVVSVSLWTAGEIPELWRERLPDNATFVRPGARSAAQSAQPTEPTKETEAPR